MHQLVAVLNMQDEEEKCQPELTTAIVDEGIPRELLSTNVAGFMSILDIDIEKETITFRSPCVVTAQSLPSKFALIGSIKWQDS